MVGGPEWLGEIAASSASIDLGKKLEVYRRSGVREYVVWRVPDGALDWFVLRNSQLEPAAPDADGIHRSQVFPGLWLNAHALLAGNLLQVLQTLAQGVTTSEHAAFIAHLRQAAL